MSSSASPSATPIVWLACLRCHSAGSLVGKWVEANAATTTSIEELHEGTWIDPAASGCEETWCFDTEGIPLDDELSPTEAAEWGHRLAQVEPRLRDAVCEWVRTGSYDRDGDSELPDLGAFDEAYCGVWPDFQTYAEDLAGDTGFLEGVPDAVAAYVNWSAFARDLELDYLVAPSSEGGVHVFRAG